MDAPPPLRSVHTANLSPIFQELGISVLVTTHQAGKLVMLRPDGDLLNTHFRGFSKPMRLVINDQPRLLADAFVVPDEMPDRARVTQEPSKPEEMLR
jgi:hypothetical protein